jgi:hypothetical protein
MSNDENETATRARNRTVMLTPEITGQVRARLAQETDPSKDESDPLESTRGSSGGFKIGGDTQQYSSSYAPASSPSAANGQPAPKAPAYVAPVVQNSAGVVWNKVTPLIGFLVSFDKNENGDVFELRSGRLIISSEPAAGWSYIVVEDSSVSPMHAILRIDSSGVVQVLDQLSEFGTKIKRFGSQDEETISGEKSTIEHGDIIKFGERTFHVCILALNS